MTGAYAGVRPLISSGDARRSVDISRKAELYETSSGLITITGGKLTTWRRMAKLVVDRLVERDGRDAPCRTQEIPLGEPVDPNILPRVDGVPEESYAAMAARYGHAAHDLLALAGTRTELAAPIVAGHPDLLAEAPFAASREQALSRRRRTAAADPARPGGRPRDPRVGAARCRCKWRARWGRSWAGTRPGSQWRRGASIRRRERSTFRATSNLAGDGRGV